MHAEQSDRGDGVRYIAIGTEAGPWTEHAIFPVRPMPVPLLARLFYRPTSGRLDTKQRRSAWWRNLRRNKYLMHEHLVQDNGVALIVDVLDTGTGDA